MGLVNGLSMMLMQTRASVLIALCATMSLSYCKKDDGGSDDGAVAAIDPTVLSGAQPSAQTPTTSVKGVLSDTGSITADATLQHVPGNPSNGATLAVTVGGNTLINYRYALLSDATTCNGATYSDAIATSTAITDSTGADGIKLLCVLATGSGEGGVAKVATLSHMWLKDTVPPTVAISAPAGFGPHTTPGPTTVFAVSAADDASGLDGVSLSIKNSSEQCLNVGRTAFNATCPNYAALTGSGTTLSLTVNDSLFDSGQAYTLTAKAEDQAGNQQTSSIVGLTWDTTAPSGPASVTAVTGSGRLVVSWTTVTGAADYIVTRKAGSAVDVDPVGGRNYSAGDILSMGNSVAYVGTAVTFIDTDISPFTTYFYKAYALDAAGNMSTGTSGSGIADATPAFQGITNAFVWGPGRRVATEWQQYAADGVFANTTYQVFSANSSGAQNFNAAPDQELSAVSSTYYQDTGASANVYLAAKSKGVDNIQDSNSREVRVRLGSGVNHKLTNSGRYRGTDPLSQTYLRLTWAVDNDPWGNTVFSGSYGVVLVLCRETAQASYCKGRSIGRVYTVSGSDGLEDGADGAPGAATPMGLVNALQFDHNGNLYIADTTFFRIRVVCFNALAPGFCRGKTPGYAYHVTGTGALGDGGDDTAAKTAMIGTSYALAIDSFNNVFLGDATYRKVRVFCSTTAGGFCSGKTAGNLYVAAGNGMLADGADGTSALTTSMGEPRGLAFDSRNNLYISDWDYRRIRVLCTSVAVGSTACAGKTAGNVYRLFGVGASADGADNIDSLSGSMGQSYGIVASPAGNIYFTDSTYFRLRAICYAPAEAGYCGGKSTGFAYRVAGTGASTDGASGGLSVVTAIGGPRGVTIDATGNLIVADDFNKRIRLFCVNSMANSACSGQFPDNHYGLVGTGVSSQGWQTSALETPVGTPQGVTVDSAGNVYFGDATYRLIRAICYNTVATGFCNGKTAGHTYYVAGTGVAGDGLDALLAVATPIGVPGALTIDNQDNLYFTDNTYRRIRTVCININAGGFCQGKTSGYIYRFGGSGVAADAADNVVASTATFGVPTGIDLDAQGNAFFADSTYFRIRLICGTSTGVCAGKTIGNMYRFAGTGVTGDGINAGTTATTAMGSPADITIDPFGNIFVGDATYFRVRLICANTLGACAGRLANKVYRALGTGVTGDGLSGASGSSAIGIAFGLDTDALGNLFIADSTYRRIRLLCYDVSTGACSGLTPDNSYRFFGNGIVSADTASSTPGATTRLDTPLRDSVALTADGDIIFSGGSGSIRMFIGYH